MNPQRLRFRVVVERNGNRWRAYCPELEAYDAAAWSRTKQEARKHICDVRDMIAAEGRDGSWNRHPAPHLFYRFGCDTM